MLAHERDAAYTSGLLEGRRIGNGAQSLDAYHRGYAAGLAEGRRSQTAVSFSASIWRGLLQLVHPDKWRGSPMERTANDVTRWLLEHRPS